MALCPMLAGVDIVLAGLRLPRFALYIAFTCFRYMVPQKKKNFSQSFQSKRSVPRGWLRGELRAMPAS